MYVTATLVLAVVMALTGCVCLILALSWNRAWPAAPEWHGLGHVPGPLATDPAADDGILAVDDELRAAAAQARVLALHGAKGVRVDVAVQPGLMVRADAGTLRVLLTDLLLCALRDHSCGRILIAAAQQAGRVRIAVSDDGLATATSSREAELRRAEQLVALQGGSLQIDVYPGEGATVAVHLPIPHQAGRAARRPAPAMRPDAHHAAADDPLAVQAGDFQDQL